MPKKILLIEDEQGLARMYKHMFETNGVEMELALTAEEGRQKLEESRPDLILLDILLPKKSGLEFLAEIRAEEEFKDLPVIVLSNYDAVETKTKAEKFGIEAYLMKADYTPSQLKEKVQEILLDEDSSSEG